MGGRKPKLKKKEKRCNQYYFFASEELSFFMPFLGRKVFTFEVRKSESRKVCLPPFHLYPQLDVLCLPFFKTHPKSISKFGIPPQEAHPFCAPASVAWGRDCFCWIRCCTRASHVKCNSHTHTHTRTCPCSCRLSYECVCKGFSYKTTFCKHFMGP